MAKTLGARIEEYISSLPEGKFELEPSDKAPLHEQLAVKLGDDVDPEKVLDAYMALMATTKLGKLLNEDRHLVGLIVAQEAPMPKSDMKIRNGDPIHVVMAKCIAALLQESGKGREVREVLSELVGSVEPGSQQSALALLRKLGFYKSVGFQRKEYEIPDDKRQAVTAQEIAKLLEKKTPPTPAFKAASIETPVPATSKAATSRRSASDKPRAGQQKPVAEPKAAAANEPPPQPVATTPEVTPKVLIERLTDELEAAGRVQQELEARIVDLEKQLNEQSQQHTTTLAELRSELEVAHLKITQLETGASVPADLTARATRLLDSRRSADK